jgi:Rap1a immunity proteins
MTRRTDLRKPIGWAFIFLIMLCPLTALSQALTSGTIVNGNQLFSDCDKAGDAPNGDACLHYIVVDVLLMHKEICVPSGVTISQLADIATKYLRDNPEVRHFTAAVAPQLRWRVCFLATSDPSNQPNA